MGSYRQKVSKDDVQYALERMSSYIDNASKEEFNKIISGSCVNSVMIPPLFTLDDINLKDEPRRLVRLEFRVI
jgi:hypothetical protein